MSIQDQMVRNGDFRRFVIRWSLVFDGERFAIEELDGNGCELRPRQITLNGLHSRASVEFMADKLEKHIRRYGLTKSFYKKVEKVEAEALALYPPD